MKNKIVIASSIIIMILSLIILTNIFSVIGVSFAMLISCFLDVLINYLLILKTFKSYDVKTI